MEPKKESKKAACDVKVKLIKLGVALATRPVAGESLNRPDESKLSSVRFLLSPLVVLRTPALICDQRATGRWLGAKIKHNGYR